MLPLTFQILLAVVWPTGPSIKVDQGLRTKVHGCTIDVGVGKEQAEIWTTDAAAMDTKQVVRKGQLVVACGVLYRLYELLHEPDGDWPSRIGTAVILDLSPPRKPVLHPGAIVLTLGGEVHVGSPNAVLSALSLQRTRRGLYARFTVRVSGVERPVAGIAGDRVAIGPERYRIAAVLPPNAKTGVPGWVELVPAPRR